MCSMKFVSVDNVPSLAAMSCRGLVHIGQLDHHLLGPFHFISSMLYLEICIGFTGICNLWR